MSIKVLLHVFTYADLIQVMITVEAFTKNKTSFIETAQP